MKNHTGLYRHHPKTRASALENLLGRIFSGDYLENQAIDSEMELSSSIGVSRTVIREALHILNAKGILRQEGASKNILQPFLRWNLLDAEVLDWMQESRFLTDLLEHIFEVRLIIEPEAAMLAAVRASTSEIRKIEEALERFESYAHDKKAEAVQADIDFHNAILEASDNAILERFNSLFNSFMQVTIRLAFEPAQQPEPSLARHRKLFEMIRSRNPVGARKSSLDILKFSIADLRSLNIPIRPETLLIVDQKGTAFGE